jgi:hypothetical protein
MKIYRKILICASNSPQTLDKGRKVAFSNFLSKDSGTTRKLLFFVEIVELFENKKVEVNRFLSVLRLECLHSY